MIDATHASLTMTDIGRVMEKLQGLRGRLSPSEQAILDDLMRTAGVLEVSPPQYNPFLPNVHIDPYPHYHLIQSENPVHFSEAMQAWIVCRYDDVVDALRNPHLSYRTGLEAVQSLVPADEQSSIRAVSQFLTSLLNEIDPPDHTRLRVVMTRAMSTAIGVETRERIQVIANRLLDAVEPLGEMNIVVDFANPLPAIVGADLLGIPAADRDRFATFIHDVIHTFSQGFSGAPAMRQGEAAVTELTAYLASLLRERAEAPRTDMLSVLAKATELNDNERVLIAANIMMGMHENLTHAISLTMRTLLSDAELGQWVRDHPEQAGIVVEEALRYEGTAPILSRRATEDVTIGSTTIPKGARVVLLIAAANRDVDHFDAPDCFVPNRRPNTHIAFGAGKRACPGSSLARSVLRVSLETLLSRFPSMRLLETEPAMREEINIRGLQSLKVAL